ncbi:MAG: UDP-glucuronosyltransferase [Thaumarchaeota archaeon]|jgi:UDP-N-acetylglucosamine--N-acetylmuramyl-(pentapeptide) pyrophosphoryl-undecaprenol N-acetylglucosamine transferase|nr:UDP-glucuronosyltransferase [Nitrososphaerota archaeon]
MTEILFFSSPIGLGHATRDLAIINQLKIGSCKVFSGSSAIEFFHQNSIQAQDVYSPPKFDVIDGKLEKSLKWLWSYYRYYKRCKEISSKIISNEKPRVIISDEDFASIAIAQERKIPNIIITDILETKFISGFGGVVEKKMNKTMHEMLDKANRVIIPELGKNQNNIIRTGPIVRKIQKNRDELRDILDFKKKTIVLCVGGTDAGIFLIKQTIEAIKKIQIDVDLVLVSGPKINKKFSDDVRNLGFVSNLHEIIFAADLVISLAGKSTIDESIVYGTPGIFIPIKGHFEQEDNAKEIGFKFEDIFNLENLIGEKLNKNRNEQQQNGVNLAGMEISKILFKENND